MLDDNATIYPVILNSSSLVPSNANNTYRYTFPQGSVRFQNSKIAINNISLYYSWFNISSANGNNTFQIRWPNGGLGAELIFNVTIPDGFYDANALNAYIQAFCVANALYLIDNNGDFRYYIVLQPNPNAYAIQISLLPLVTALPALWTAPVGFPAFPTATYTPRIVIQNNNFQEIIGFTAATYPAAQQTTTQSFLSNFTPQITPVSSIIVTCSLLNNKFSNPQTIIYSFSPTNTSFGSIIETSPNELAFIDIQDGNYSDFDITFLDQNFNPLLIRDSNLIIQLLIKSNRDRF
jgi:hypothetical protein